MNQKIAAIAARLTAHKGNHPLLWIVVGIFGFGTSCVTIWQASLRIPTFRIWRAYTTNQGPRFELVRFDTEPLLFSAYLSALMVFTAFALTVGVVSIISKKRIRQSSARFNGVLSE